MRLHQCGCVIVQPGERINGMLKAQCHTFTPELNNSTVRKGGFYHIHITHKGE